MEEYKEEIKTEFPELKVPISRHSSHDSTRKTRSRLTTGRTNRSNLSQQTPISPVMPNINSRTQSHTSLPNTAHKSHHSSRHTSARSSHNNIPTYAQPTETYISHHSEVKEIDVNNEENRPNTVSVPHSTRSTPSLSQVSRPSTVGSYVSPQNQHNRSNYSSSRSYSSYSTATSTSCNNNNNNINKNYINNLYKSNTTVSSEPIIPEWFKVTKTQIQPVAGGKGYFSTSLTKTLESKDMPNEFHIDGVENPLITHRPAFDYITHTPERIIPVPTRGEVCVDAPSFMHRTVYYYIYIFIISSSFSSY